MADASPFPDPEPMVERAAQPVDSHAPGPLDGLADWESISQNAAGVLGRRKKRRKGDDEAENLLQQGLDWMRHLPRDQEKKLAEKAHQVGERKAEVDRYAGMDARSDPDQAAFRKARGGLRTQEAGLVKQVIEAAKSSSEMSADMAANHGLDAGVHRRRIQHADSSAVQERVAKRNANLDSAAKSWIRSVRPGMHSMRGGAIQNIPGQLDHVEIVASEGVGRPSSWREIAQQLYEAGHRVESRSGRTKAITHEVISVSPDDSSVGVSPASAVEMFRAHDLIAGRQTDASIVVVHKPHQGEKGMEEHWHAHRLSVSWDRPEHPKITAALATRLSEQLAYGQGRISAAASTRRDVVDGYLALADDRIDSVHYSEEGQRWTRSRSIADVAADLELLEGEPAIRKRDGRPCGAILSPKPSMAAADVNALVWHVVGAN